MHLTQCASGSSSVARWKPRGLQDRGQKREVDSRSYLFQGSGDSPDAGHRREEYRESAPDVRARSRVGEVAALNRGSGRGKRLGKAPRKRPRRQPGARGRKTVASPSGEGGRKKARQGGWVYGVGCRHDSNTTPCSVDSSRSERVRCTPLPPPACPARLPPSPHYAVVSHRMPFYLRSSQWSSPLSRLLMRATSRGDVDADATTTADAARRGPPSVAVPQPPAIWWLFK
ncbi:hypothetical protein EAI_11361 [Harpegnathos saltator]|uniref:Uncharacterized protein n=1 Tax=Harpegnathos saltator TaxID=610380 RepID=E2B5J2_HARSA|nr:hypothetical protein EAI_11361 [Harpegnathos saltator]